MEEAKRVVLSDRGKNIMDKIREILDKMIDEEERLLELRSKAPEESKQHTDILLIVLLIFGLIIGGGIAGYISFSISTPISLFGRSRIWPKEDSIL